MKVDLNMFMGVAQQAGLFSNSMGKSNANESFQAVFENSLESSANHRLEARESVKPKTSSENTHKSRNIDPKRSVMERAKSVIEKSENSPATENNAQTETVNPQGEDVKTVSETSNTENTATEAVKSVDKKTITMAELAEKLNLSDEQLSKLSALLGISVQELAEVEIQIDKNSNNSLMAVLQNGETIDLNELIASQMDIQTDAELVAGADATEKLAKLLDLSTEQADALASELKIESIQIENKSASGNDTKERNNSPFLSGKAAESKVTQDEFKNSVNENSKQNTSSTGNMVEDVKTALHGAVQNSAAKGTVTDNKGNALGSAAQTGLTNTVESAGQTKELRDVPRQTTADKVFNQIVEKAKILSLPNKTEARISLTPANLGSVDIKIVVQDAIVKGSIVVENSQVKKIVEENINSLKAILADQGVNVEEITVDINDKQTKFSQSGNANDDYREKAAYLDGFKDSEAVKSEETIVSEKAEARRAVRNSTVYVTA